MGDIYVGESNDSNVQVMITRGNVWYLCDGNL